MVYKYSYEYLLELSKWSGECRRSNSGFVFPLHIVKQRSHKPFFKALCEHPLVVTVISLWPKSQVVDWPCARSKLADGNLKL